MLRNQLRGVIRTLQRIYVIPGFLKFRHSDSGLKYSNFMAHESAEERELCLMQSAKMKLFLKSDLNADSMSLSGEEMPTV